MNCPKCNAPTKQDAKFCTGCGFKLVPSSNSLGTSTNCGSCGNPLRPGAKFCTTCGFKVETAPTPLASTPPLDKTVSAPISSIKNRIFWNVQNGEVAHRFNESEMIEFDSAVGIMINDGTTAYIKSNGITIAEIKGGCYDFLNPNQLNSVLNERHGGIAGVVKSGVKFLTNLIYGQPVRESIEASNPEKRPENQTSIDGIIEGMKQGNAFSVTLKLDKSFPLVFQIQNVETKFLKVDFGLHAMFRIDDFKLFSEYFLTNTNSATCEKIMNELSSSVRESIESAVHNLEVSAGRLPDGIINQIKANCESISNDRFFGLKLEKIIQVTSSNEDLARLKEIGRELYLSELELAGLFKTNEFQNKLTLTQNTQKLTEAKNDAEFHKALSAINNSSTRDRMLSEDEMDKFYMILSREKRIREAKNDDEVTAALIDIEKTGLLRDEDLENLKISIQERAEDHESMRFHSVSLLQLNQTLELDRKKLEWEYEIGDKQIELEISRKRKELQAEIGYTQLEIEKWKTEEDYQNSVFYRELEKTKVEQLQEIELESRRAKSQIDLDRERMELELEEQRQREKILENIEKRKHEQEMAARAQEMSHVKDLTQLDKEKQENLAQIYKGMSFEQIMAANPNLSPEVAAQLAKKFEADAEAEKVKFAQLQNDTRAQDAKELADKQAQFLKDQMLMQQQMMKDMMNTTSAMTGHLMGHKEKQKDEYKERLEREEDRHDKTQDKAMDYITRSNKPAPKDTPTKPTKPGETGASAASANSSASASPANSNEKASNSKLEKKSCKKCSYGPLESDAKFCPECGNEPN